MSRIAHVCVVVPVNDEQDTLHASLDGVATAVTSLREVRSDVTTDLVVALDNCRDDSAAIVRARIDWQSVTARARNVGRARGQGTAFAVGRAPCSPARIWTAHTDGDSVVPPQWLTGMLDHAEAGAELVLGTVEPTLNGSALTRWRARHHDVTGHPHVHGANLGIRADTLARLGGWPTLPTGEDVTLVARARRQHCAIASVSGLAVRTSARRAARAPAGFSSYLRELDAVLDG